MHEALLEVFRRQVPAIDGWKRFNRLICRAVRFYTIEAHAADNLGKIPTTYLPLTSWPQIAAQILIQALSGTLAKHLLKTESLRTYRLI